ncbi:MAG: invasion associated locus B family protein [Brevirhabdus sp.]
MISPKLALAAAAVVTACATGAFAQDTTNRVAAKTDWSVFVEDNPSSCFVVSAPKESVHTREGRVVAVNRGEIRLFVSFFPGSNVKGEVSFRSGYPFREGSTVSLQIGDSSFDLFTSPKDETAWPPTPQDDAKITAAMKRGASAVVTGISGRGTQTKDTFSLLGFTAALEEAQKRCGG